MQTRHLTTILIAAGLVLAVVIALAVGYNANDVSSLDAGSIRDDIRAVMDGKPYTHASWGLLVVDLSSGERLMEQNAGQMFTPGSTTKLFTVAAALDALGADYRFATPIYARGTIDQADRLNGDLILVASGDLTMGGRTLPDGSIAFENLDHGDANAIDGATLTPTDPLAGLDELARQVRASGIRAVTGDVIVDDRLFDHFTESGSIITPILINDNVIDIVITPGEAGGPAAVDTRPHTSAVRVDAAVTTIESSRPPQIDIVSGGRGVIRVTGQISAGREALVRTYPVEDPSSFARSLFIEALQRNNVSVNVPVQGINAAARLPDRGAYAMMEQVALLTSPPFSENAKVILKVSQNLHADTLPCLIAVQSGKRTFYEGMSLEGAFFERAGLDSTAFSLGDGQGGVDADQISPEAEVELLRYMATRPDFEAFYQALPVLGVGGSLADTVGPDSPALGRVHAKTGTRITYDAANDRGILRAKALAGYIDAASGRQLAFAVFVNDGPMEDMDAMFRAGSDLGRICEIIHATY